MKRRTIRAGAPVLVLVAALCGSAGATSPPAPPPPTIAEIVESSQVVFTGRVESVAWQPVLPGGLDSGDIVLNVKVATRMLNARMTPKRVVYVAGRVSMTESQAKARYEGRSFVFVGWVFRLPDGKTKVMAPPSGEPPYELSDAPEFKREVRKLKRIPGPHDKWPGPR